MKKGINVNFRKFLIGILFSIGIIVSFMLYNTVNSGFTEEEISLYSYINRNDVSYNVFVKPNILYDEDILGEDNVYITEFVDYIDSTFLYEFSGERDAQINGSYKVTAIVEGYERVDREEKTIWKKNFPIIERIEFESEDNTLLIEEDIVFNLDDFIVFTNHIANTIKTRSQDRVTIVMDIDIEAKTDSGTLKENRSTSLIVPLGVSHFEINKNGVIEETGSINVIESTPIPTNKKLVTAYSGIISIILISLLYLIFYTEGIATDELEKFIKVIFKKHGARMVAVNSNIHININDQSKLLVNSIDDLVKIADEIEKPILYKHSINIKDITKFYVLDNSYIYLFDAEILVEKDKETKRESNSIV